MVPGAYLFEIITMIAIRKTTGPYERMNKFVVEPKKAYLELEDQPALSLGQITDSSEANGIESLILDIHSYYEID